MSMITPIWGSTTIAGTQMEIKEEHGVTPLIPTGYENLALSQGAKQLMTVRRNLMAPHLVPAILEM